MLNNGPLIAGAASTKSALSGVSQSASRFGSTLTQGVTLPILGVLAAGIKTAKGLDEAYNEIRKTYNSTGKTVEEQSKNTEKFITTLVIPAVTKLTRQFGLGREEVVHVMGRISALGKTGPAAVDLLTKSVEFASAAGLELEESLDAVVALSNTFGFSGDKLTKVMRGLNVVENDTAASGQDLAKGLARASGAASAMVGPGFRAEEAVAAIAAGMAVLKERGQETARSADALRAIFTRIYTPTEKLKGLWDKLGTSWEKSNGDLVPFPELLQNVAKNFDKLSQAEQVAFTKQAIGVEFGGLFRNMIQDVQKDTDKSAKTQSTYNKTLDKFGDVARGSAAHQREMAIQQASLEASLGRFTAAWDLLVESMTPAITAVFEPISQWFFGMVEWVSKLDDSLKKQIATWALVAAAIGPVLLIIAGITGAVAALSGAGVLTAVALLGAAFFAIQQSGLSLGDVFKLVMGYIQAFTQYIRNVWATVNAKFGISCAGWGTC